MENRTTTDLKVIKARPDRFTWGKIIKIHTISRYDIVEYQRCRQAPRRKGVMPRTPPMPGSRNQQKRQVRNLLRHLNRNHPQILEVSRAISYGVLTSTTVFPITVRQHQEDGTLLVTILQKNYRLSLEEIP